MKRTERGAFSSSGDQARGSDEEARPSKLYRRSDGSAAPRTDVAMTEAPDRIGRESIFGAAAARTVAPVAETDEHKVAQRQVHSPGCPRRTSTMPREGRVTRTAASVPSGFPALFPRGHSM